MKVLSQTVGAFQENAYLVIDEATNEAVFIDPGAEPEVLVELVRKSGADLRAMSGDAAARNGSELLECDP